ncbi:hypothetical protein O5699_01135 [Escherichia coli]|nr:hypothetical protein [Escherichia coli]
MTIFATQTGRTCPMVWFLTAPFIKTFELRLPVMRDNGKALEETEERFQTVDGFTADYYYRAVLMAATLVRLGYSAGRD